MNRIQLGAEANDSLATSSIQIQQAFLSEARPRRLPHRLFVPLHYERNYAYPLLVWLHGPGDDECQLQRVMPLISMRNYVAIAPRGTSQVDGEGMGYEWRQTRSSILAAEQRALQCIDIMTNKFNVARHRVFIGGYDCGGTMAFRIATRNPHAFAGVLSIGGPFPRGHHPLGNVAEARRVPLFVANGRDAQNYDVQRTCEDLQLFHVAGFSVTLRQYPCGDELTSQMLHDMDVWMMEQVTGVSDSCDDESECREAG